MRLLLAAVLLSAALTGCATPGPTPDQVRAARQRQYPVTTEVGAARGRLVASFGGLLAGLYPSYNGIRVLFRGNVYGDEWGFLQAEHPLFSQYELASGPTAPTVRQWIAEHAGELRAGRISAVDVGGASIFTGNNPPL